MFSADDLHCVLQSSSSVSQTRVRHLKSLLESVMGHPKAWTQTRLLHLLRSVFKLFKLGRLDIDREPGE